jgi:hypothetical protein
MADPVTGMDFLNADYDEATKTAAAAKAAAEQKALADKATLNPYAGAALQGATFGFGDELTAGVRSVLGSTPYGEALDQERAGHKQFSDAHPIQNVGMQVVGAIPHMLVTRGKSGEAVAGDVAATVAPKFWAGVRSAGLRGGIEGAGQGFGEGEGGPGEDKSILGRFGSAAEGALAGTVGGGALDIVGTGVKAAAKGLWNRFGPAVSDKAALTAAQAKLAQNLQREGGLPLAEQKLADYSTQLAENTAAGLPNARLTLGEITGGQSRAAMDAAVQIPGKGAAEVARDITAREGERMGRVRSALTTTFGDLDGTFTAKTKLYDERKAAADPLYNAAFATAKPLTAGDIEYLQRVPRGAIDYAQQLAQADGRRLSFVPRFDEHGRMINNDLVPTPEDMHHIKTGLDMFLQANTDAVTGRVNQLAGKYAPVRDMIRDRLDTLTTGDDGNSLYKAAREAWAGPTAKVDALNLGEHATKMRPDELAARLANMTEAERAFAVQGWMGKVNADLDAVHLTGHANPVRQVFSTQEQMDTARAMLGAMGLPDAEVAKRFTQLSNYFAHEGVGASGEQQLMRGSQTASRGAWMKDLGLSTIPTLSAGYFDPHAALAVGATLAAGVGTKALNAARTENMNTQMLRMLGSTVPAEQMAAVKALREAAARRAAPVSPYHTSIAGTTGGQVGAAASPGYLPGILDPDHPDVRR